MVAWMRLYVSTYVALASVSVAAGMHRSTAQAAQAVARCQAAPLRCYYHDILPHQLARWFSP